MNKKIIIITIIIVLALVFILDRYTTLFLSSSNLIEFDSKAGVASRECLLGGIDYLNSAADYIIIGSVTDVRELYDFEKGLEIYSTVKIEKYEKGSSPDQTLDFVRRSGRTNEAIFINGDQIKLYLKKFEAGLGVLCNAVFSDSFPNEASIGGPLDTTLAEVVILSVNGETAYLRIDRVRDYERYPGATYPEVKSGDELEVKIKDVVPQNSGGAGERAQQGESPPPSPPLRPDVVGRYLADMRLCITEYIGGLSCEYEGWSADLYPL
ncbi:MAG: hypothetical protein Q7S84_02420 [bacterium]|nr:hypothetical protein [bacterium]